MFISTDSANNQYSCAGEHFRSDPDIFQFDFKFVKPHDVPPLLCFNVQTEMGFGVEQLFYNAYPLETGAVLLQISFQSAR